VTPHLPATHVPLLFIPAQEAVIQLASTNMVGGDFNTRLLAIPAQAGTHRSASI